MAFLTESFAAALVLWLQRPVLISAGLYSILQVYRTRSLPGWKYLHFFAVADAQGRIVQEGFRPLSWYKTPDVQDADDAPEDRGEEGDEDEGNDGTGAGRARGLTGGAGAAGQDLRQRQAGGAQRT
ncbi:hypothetical protein JCM11251_002168 [Rhodosporidiobolus azoricus]